MSGRAVRFVSWTVVSVTVLLLIGGTVLSTLNRELPGTAGIAVYVLLDLVLLGFVVLGLLVVSRRPGSPVGWTIAGAGVLAVASGFMQSYAIYALFTAPGGLPGGLPGGELLALLSTLLSVPVLFAAPATLLLLFPDGTLPGRRWRPVFWLVILTTCSTMAGVILTPALNDAPFDGVVNPLGLELPRALRDTLSFFGWPGWP